MVDPYSSSERQRDFSYHFGIRGGQYSDCLNECCRLHASYWPDAGSFPVGTFAKTWMHIERIFLKALQDLFWRKAIF